MFSETFLRNQASLLKGNGFRLYISGGTKGFPGRAE